MTQTNRAKSDRITARQQAHRDTSAKAGRVALRQQANDTEDKIRKIPVLYHIPKNAGTYISDWMLISLRFYRRTYTNWLRTYSPERDSIKCLQVIKDGKIIAKLLIGDPDSFCENNLKFTKKHSKTEWDIQLEDLTSEALMNVFLFGVIIEGRGFKVSHLISPLLTGYNQHKILILRDPFSRAQSICNYIKSERSKHEQTHGCINADTFEEYIMSEQLEDSWLIRNIADVDNAIELNEQHFNTTVDILSSCNAYSIKHVTQAVQEAFMICYNFDITRIKLKNWDFINKNQGNEDTKIQFESLSLEIQQTFINRTFWDNKLYKTFIK